MGWVAVDGRRTTLVLVLCPIVFVLCPVVLALVRTPETAPSSAYVC